MADRLDEMQLQMRRASIALEEETNVSMMKNMLRLAVTGCETVCQRFGILDLEGWSSSVCSDLGRHNNDLARIYRKYWRRKSSSSPELNLAVMLIGSAGMHHMQRTMSRDAPGGRGAGAPGRGEERRRRQLRAHGAAQRAARPSDSEAEPRKAGPDRRDGGGRGARLDLPPSPPAFPG